MAAYGIPNIEEKIRQQLKKLGLMALTSVEKVLSDPTCHSYFTICQGKKGKFFFKARISALEKERTRARREIGFLAKLAELEDFRLPSLTFRLLDYQIGDFDWFLAEFLEGKNMGSREILDKTSLSLAHLPAVMDIFFALREIPEDFLRFKDQKIPPLEKHDALFYQRQVQDFLASPECCDMLSENEIEKIEEIFSCKDHLDLLDKSCHTLSHGDFQPPNLFLTKKSLKIVDWDQVHLDNPVFDAAFFWTHLWSRPKLRNAFWRKWLNASLEKEEVKSLFKLSSILLLLVQVVSLNGFLKYQKERMIPSELERRRRALKIHLSTLSSILYN